MGNFYQREREDPPRSRGRDESDPAGLASHVAFYRISDRHGGVDYLTLSSALLYNVCMDTKLAYKSNRNIYYSCKYHVVWCSKYRRKVLAN